MSIKSEKAKEAYYQLPGDCTKREIEPIIIQAESDARERAVRAHAKECHFMIGDRATCGLSDFHTPCDAIPQCNWKQNFLKHYDNE